MGFLSLAVCGGRRGADVWRVHRDCSQPRMLSLEPQYVFIVFTLAFSGAEFHPNTCKFYKFRMRIHVFTDFVFISGRVFTLNTCIHFELPRIAALGSEDAGVAV